MLRFFAKRDLRVHPGSNAVFNTVSFDQCPAGRQKDPVDISTCNNLYDH